MPSPLAMAAVNGKLRVISGDEMEMEMCARKEVGVVFVVLWNWIFDCCASVLNCRSVFSNRVFGWKLLKCCDIERKNRRSKSLIL